MASFKVEGRVRADGVTVWDVKHRVPQRGVPARLWKRVSTTCASLAAATALRDELSETVEGRRVKAVQSDPSAALDLYIASKRAQADGISDNTEKFFRQQIGQFVAFTGEKALDALTSRDLDAYLLSKREAWAKNSVRLFVATLRGFLRGLAKMKPPVACRDITAGFVFPKKTHSDEPYWTWDEVLRTCTAAAEMEAEGLLSLVVPIHVCAYTGIDEPDFGYFTWGDIDTTCDPWVISCPRHKTGQARKVKCHPRLRAVLESRRGTPEALVCEMPKHYSGGYRALLRVLKRAGIPADRRAGGWKRLRRSYLTELSRQHTDLATLRGCAGHSLTSTETLKYLRTDEDRKAAAILTLA